MTQSDTGLLETDPPSRPRRARWRWLLIGPLALTALFATLVLSFSPSVPEPRAPDTPSAEAARRALQQITGSDVARGEPVQITLSQRELAGLAALGSEALSPLRVQARLAAVLPQTGPTSKTRAASTPANPAGELIIDLSHQIAGGAWINATAIVRPAAARKSQEQEPSNLPDIALTLGRLPIPQSVTHWALARVWLRIQGDVARPTPLAEALRSFTATPERAQLVLINPGRGAALAGLAQAGGTTPEPRALAAVYCAIAGTADADLAMLVRNTAAIGAPAGVSPEDHNRVVLTAIAMRAVPEYREKLAGTALRLLADCGASADPVTLAGREDLAKHWALSAALAATLGSQVARSMGTWKELADSTDGGTGFSFVDLSADRSGERFAIAAVNPQLARPVLTRLAAITEEQLLPRELLAKPEGLDQAAFERDYTAVTSPEYARALSAIDRLLGNAGVP